MAAAAATAAALVLGGCGLPEPPEDGSGTTAPSPTTTPSARATPPPQPVPAVPTVEALTAHLDGVINSTYEAGRLTCSGSGPIAQGSAVTCDWSADVAEDLDGYRSGGSGPVFVAVLDDSGRYTFSSRLAGAYDAAVPADYPAGTISCRTLQAAPQAAAGGQGSPSWGLDYATVMHYWMSLGSPGSMDDDGNGLPCETVYAADVVQRVSSSPLTITPGSGAVTREQVRAHAEAVTSGVYDSSWLEASDSGYERYVTDNDCGGGQAVAAGDTMICANWRTEWGMRQSGGVFISVLDDTGRYTFGYGPCCGGGPTPVDYPPDATCAQVSVPPPDSVWNRGLEYRLLMHTWMYRDQDPSMDGDGDGRPCEEVYASAQVDKVVGSTLQP